MNHHSGLLDLRRVAAVAFAILLAFTLTAAIAAPGADAKKKTKVSLKITTKNQAKLLQQKKLTVKVKSTGKTKVKVSAKYFKSKSVSFKKKGTKTVKLKLTGKGSSQLSLCGSKTVKATGKYGKKKASAKKKLAKDKSRCITVPLGTDPEHCDFLDTTVCLQPFANDYYTKDADTNTGKQLNIASKCNSGKPLRGPHRRNRSEPCRRLQPRQPDRAEDPGTRYPCGIRLQQPGSDH